MWWVPHLAQPAAQSSAHAAVPVPKAEVGLPWCLVLIMKCALHACAVSHLSRGCAQVALYFERLTGDLEASAHPALDALTVKVSTTNLERVRRIKNRMVRLTTRVETLREVLEKFLDDDSVSAALRAGAGPMLHVPCSSEDCDGLNTS